MTKLRIAFIHRPSNPYLSGKRPNVNFRKFYFDALPKVPGIEVDFLGGEGRLDLAPIARKYDVYLFFSPSESGCPRIEGADTVRGLKVCMAGDSHNWPDVAEDCKRNQYDVYFYQHATEFFHSHFPPHYPYWWIPQGVDAKLYASVKPWRSRGRSTVLLTGVLGEKYYPLRTHLSQQKLIRYVEPGSYHRDTYTPRDHDGDGYAALLGRWTASIASGYTICNKYFEIAAAGCLTFAEVTPENGCRCIGFVDGHNAATITPDNAMEKIREFLATPYARKWEDIAARGRDLVLDHYTHGHTVRMLVDKIKKAL